VRSESQLRTRPSRHVAGTAEPDAANTTAYSRKHFTNLIF